MQISESVRQQVLSFQQTEITEHHIYKRLAKRVKSPENAKVIEQIAEDELRHYNGWKKYTNQDVHALVLCLVLLFDQRRFRLYVWYQTHGKRGTERPEELRRNLQSKSGSREVPA
jgi:hypothetical protein